MCLSACENRGCDTAEYDLSVLIYLQALLTHSLRYTAQDEISLPETFIKKCQIVPLYFKTKQAH